MVDYGKCIYKGLRLSDILNDNHKRNLLRLNQNINISEYLDDTDYEVEESNHGLDFIKNELKEYDSSDQDEVYDLDALLENDIGLMDLDIGFMPEELEIIECDDDPLLIEAGPKITANMSNFQLHTRNYNGPLSVSHRKRLPDLYLNSVMDSLKIEKTMTPSTALGWAVCINRLREKNEKVKAEAIVEAIKTCRMKVCRELVNGHSIEFDGMGLKLYKVLKIRSKGKQSIIVEAMEKGAKIYKNGKRTYDIKEDDFYTCDIPVNDVNDDLLSCILKSDIFPENMGYLFENQIANDLSNLENFVSKRNQSNVF
jgi:hypothetical protein